MSARVVNPFSLQEMRRLARPVAFRPDPVAKARVCRNLWGSAAADDSVAFALREMKEQRERAMEQWNFDFTRDIPRGGGRYEWVPINGRIPSAYRMPRMVPFKPINMEAVLETARATVPTVPAREPQAGANAERAGPPATPLASETPAATVPPAMASPEAVTRQTTISDYFRKKRPHSSKRKMEEEMPAAKRARSCTSLADV